MTSSFYAAGVVVMFIFIPIFVPGLIWMLPFVLLGFFAVTYYEPITSQIGSMPSLLHCYYKALFALRHAKLNAEDEVPGISANAVGVLFNFDNVLSMEVLSADMLVEGATHPEYAALVVSNKDIYDNPTTTDKDGNTVKAPDTIKTVARVHTSSFRDMPGQFSLVPAFNMELSIMVFCYFPLSLRRATLCASDLTTFFAVNRGCVFAFGTRVSACRRKGTDVFVDFSTTFLTSVDNIEDPQLKAEILAKLPPPPPPAPVKRGQRKIIPPSTKVVYANLTNTYIFPDATVDNSKLIQHAPLLSEDSSSVASFSLQQAILPKHTAALANVQSNLHPRYFSNSMAASLFGAQTNTIDSALLYNMTTTVFNDLNINNKTTATVIDKNSPLALDFKYPNRLILERDPSVVARAPSVIDTVVYKPTDILEQIPYRSCSGAEDESKELYPTFQKRVSSVMTVKDQVLARSTLLFDAIKTEYEITPSPILNKDEDDSNNKSDVIAE